MLDFDALVASTNNSKPIPRSIRNNIKSLDKLFYIYTRYLNMITAYNLAYTRVVELQVHPRRPWYLISSSLRQDWVLWFESSVC